MVTLFDAAVQPGGAPPAGRIVKTTVSSVAAPGVVRVGDATAFVAVDTLCLPGDEVVLALVDGAAIVVGNLTVRPGSGTVVSVGATRARVRAGQTLVEVPWVGGTPTVGTMVAVNWTPEGGWIAGALSEQPAAPAPTPGGGGQEPATLTLAPAASWVMRGGAARPDTPDTVLQGHWSTGSQSDNTGFVAVGRPAGVDGRTCRGCRLSLARAATSHGASGPAVPVVRAHANTGPGTPVWVGDPLPLTGLARGEAGVWDVPAAWGQGVLDGTVAGVALVGTGVAAYLAAPVASVRLEVTI
jgi:hypothetical protein